VSVSTPPASRPGSNPTYGKGIITKRYVDESDWEPYVLEVPFGATATQTCKPRVSAHPEHWRFRCDTTMPVKLTFHYDDGKADKVITPFRPGDNIDVGTALESVTVEILPGTKAKLLKADPTATSGQVFQYWWTLNPSP
jgi:hypothetical protein